MKNELTQPAPHQGVSSESVPPLSTITRIPSKVQPVLNHPEDLADKCCSRACSVYSTIPRLCCGARFRMSFSQNEPLIGAACQQTAVDVGTPAVVGSASSSMRPYKVAGFTLLACLLIAGQGLTAYFLLRQGSDITSLEQQTGDLQVQLSKPQPASVPMKMHLPMHMMPMLMDDSVNEEGTSTEATNGGPLDSSTQCQLEALGLKPTKLPSFRPECDEQGNYKSQQCWHGERMCWCVDAGGLEVPGTLTQGPARCTVSSGSAGRLNHMLSYPDARVFSDE